MQVILLQRIEKLGKLGEIVSVRPGYARNYLLPKGVALRATKDNIAHFEKEKENLEALNLQHKTEAEKLAKRLEGKMITLIRQASEGGQLYGSVSARDIAEALDNEHVSKNHVKIDHPIKTIGIHGTRVQLHAEVSITIGVNVAMSEDEAKAQEKTNEQIAEVVSEKE
jgi:large subunit ribosomal protein L9